MNWYRIKGWLKIIGIGFAFLIVFLVATFPFSRLGPKISAQLERGLSQAFGTKVSCQIIGFKFELPLGFGWDHLLCSDISGNPLVELKNSSMTLLPGYQKITGKLDTGTFAFRTNAGISSAPTRIGLQLDKIPLDKISPLISMAISKASPFIRDVKFQGTATGKLDLPLKNATSNPGAIDIEFKDLKLPEQSLIKQIGLKELAFSKSIIKAVMSAGKVTFSDVALISPFLSGKIEGGADLKEPLNQSMLNMTLKWQIQKSDALLSSSLGALLASSPCPNQDSEGFCSKKVTRFQDMMLNF